MRLAIEDMRRIQARLPRFISVATEHDAEYNQTRMVTSVRMASSTTVADEAVVRDEDYLSTAAYYISLQLIANLKEAIKEYEREDSSDPLG